MPQQALGDCIAHRPVAGTGQEQHLVRAPEPVRAGEPGVSCTQHSSRCSSRTVVSPLAGSMPRNRTVRWSRDCTTA